ncbi:hypothetical protein TWF225_011263 [Orbilia oligospora]|uniref:Uncharacterized protein n=1 Tax=Orbilia oligospora TaxID=2813651 RepID=A0A7C8JUH9_ORBOL|nr:hypothetical protein TWF751_005200 [Orbilia oligospora]KAF3169635.1 hypothetical protein TWF225_011263 [Orbilia oligospora]KAF3231211.1 hypothetical protein TWF128_004939 [Orbilia oligospora]KAF3235379.1 hypothetical protein TWF217_003163 [Orbilia oligospora]KAF3282926.1 hypothetical protein TWF132_010557 [Orbilia oligospora]
MAKNADETEMATTQSIVDGKARERAFIEWLKGYLDTIALIAGLGSSITFSIIVAEIVDPSSLGSMKNGVLFDLDQVRLIISLGWCVFTIAVGIAIFAKILFIDPIAQRNLEKNMKSSLFQYQLGVVLFLLNLLPTMAFTLISLAVTAYVPVVGWLATGCSGLAGLLALVMSIGVLDIGPSIPRLLRDISVCIHLS